MTKKSLLPVGTKVRFSVPHGKVRVGVIWRVDAVAYDVKTGEKEEPFPHFEWVRLNHHEAEAIEEGGP